MLGALAQRCVRLGTAPRLAVAPSSHTRRAWRPRRTAVLACASGHPRRLSIVHFNDVYDISARKVEPVGGAARFAAAVQSYAAEDPLVLFSGDCLNPSLLSAFTKGEQMVPILNAIGVKAACLGNHDFDFGTDALRQHMAAWNFPWLLSNVLDSNTGQPLAGAARSLVIEWAGLRVGLVGLVEREWLLTIPSLDPNKDITYIDFVDEGRRLATELHAGGADLVVALTHMRAPNDEALAAAVPEIQLILGGHDHDYVVTPAAGPHGTAIIKSGTDFREFSVIRLEVPPTEVSGGSSSSSGERSARSNGSSSNGNGAARSAAAPPRPRLLSCERVEIGSALPEHPGVAAIVAEYQDLMDTHMDQPLGRCFVDLDTRFDRVRCQETNTGSLFADIMRLGLDADAAFLNGGTIRSDQIHAAGRVSMRDFVSMLPFTDELVVVELDGQGLLEALETGVSSWPAREGRFLQVSGIEFRFDPGKPPGARVDVASVRVAGAPLDTTGARRYRVATKAYLRSGKDGFDSLLSAPVVVDGETAPRLATLVYHLLSRIEELNEAQGANTAEESDEDGGHHRPTHQEPSGGRRLRAVCDAPLPPSPCAHGLDALYFYDEITGQFGIAPAVEGRIVNVAEEAAAAAGTAGAATATAADRPSN